MQPRPLPDPLRGRPFTRTEAGRLGLTGRMLDHPRFVVPHRGVALHVADGAGELPLRLRIAAALKVLPPAAVVTGTTALHLYGVEVGSAYPLQFVTTHPHPVRRPGIAVTRSVELPPRQGPMAQPAAALLAACARLDLIDAVTAGDALLHLGLVGPEDLRGLAESSGRGVRAYRTAVGLVRERVESPRESVLRLVLVLAGLPEPDCNLVLGGAAGPIGRADLSYRHFALIVEYDGSQHLLDRRQWNHDIARLEEFGVAGYVVVRVTDHRLRTPKALVLDVERHLRRAGWVGPAPVFDARWMRLFPR